MATPKQIRRRGRLALAIVVVLVAAIVTAVAGAAVFTDQPDYAPGSTVTVSGDNSNGAGYVPGNAVDIAVSGPNGWTASCSATVAGDGSWSCTFGLSSDPSVAVGSYTYTATSVGANGDAISESGTFMDSAQNANFSTTGLPATTPVSVSYSGTNNGGHPVSDSAFTFNAPGPSSNIGLQPGSKFYCTFPASVTVGTSTYDLQEQPCGSDGVTVGPGSPAPANTITGAYTLRSSNSAPNAGSITGTTPVNEGSTHSYSDTTASDPDGDALSYTWSVSSGNASISGGQGTDTVSLEFTDGPSTVVLHLVIGDGHGHTVSPTDLSITETNVAPTLDALSPTGIGGAACIGGNTVGLGLSWSDPVGLTDQPFTYSVAWGDGNTSSAAVNALSVSGLSNTYAAGTYTMSATVKDKDNGTSTAQTYGPFSFLYNTSGILQPINLTTPRSSFKIGSTIPVKIKVTDCSGAPVSGLTLHVKLQKLDSSANPANEAFVVSVPDVGDTMRYDASGMQYIYNLSTKRSQLLPGNTDLTPGSYRVTVYGSVIASASADFDAR